MSGRSVFLKIAKIAAAIAGLVFILSWFWEGRFQDSAILLDDVRDIQTGHIIPYSIKGSTVYITEQEDHLLKTMEWLQASSLILVLAIIALRRGDPFKQR